MKESVYTPGAGRSPRVLAGRDALLHDFELMLNDVSVEGRVRAQDIILAGPRGVGKTVTVTACRVRGRERLNCAVRLGDIDTGGPADHLIGGSWRRRAPSSGRPRPHAARR